METAFRRRPYTISIRRDDTILKTCHYLNAIYAYSTYRPDRECCIQAPSSLDFLVGQERELVIATAVRVPEIEEGHR
jgi:hypothetical protein